MSGATSIKEKVNLALRLPKHIMMQSQKVLLQSPLEHSINALNMTCFIWCIYSKIKCLYKIAIQVFKIIFLFSCYSIYCFQVVEVYIFPLNEKNQSLINVWEQSRWVTSDFLPLKHWNGRTANTKTLANMKYLNSGLQLPQGAFSTHF